MGSRGLPFESVLRSEMGHGVNILLKNKEVFTGKIIAILNDCVMLQKDPVESYFAWVSLEDISAVFQDDETHIIGHDDEKKNSNFNRHDEDEDEDEDEEEAEVEDKVVNRKLKSRIIKKKV